MGCFSKAQADMVFREFEITLISARDLKPGRVLRTKAYARVSIGGGTEQQSPVDTNNGTNPALHFNIIQPIEDSAVRNDCTMLVIKLYCQRRWIRDRYIGEVHVSLKKLKDSALSATVTERVKKGSVYSQGTLQFSYRFGGTKAATEKQPFFSCIKRAFAFATNVVSLAAVCS